MEEVDPCSLCHESGCSPVIVAVTDFFGGGNKLKTLGQEVNLGGGELESTKIDKVFVFRVKKEGVTTGRDGAEEKVAVGLSGFWRVMQRSTLGGGSHTVMLWRKRTG